MKDDTTTKYIRDGRAPIPDSEVTSRVMSANRGKDTKPEIELRKALWKRRLGGYRLHWKKAPGRPDIAYPGKRIAVFVNGCFWHRCPYCDLPLPKSNTEYWSLKFSRNMERDKRKEKSLVDAGWMVITLWECELRQNLNECVERVEKAIRKREL